MSFDSESTANSSQILGQAPVKQSRAVTNTPATEGRALGGDRPPDDVEPPPAIDIAELIRENKRVGVLLKKKLGDGALVADGKDADQICELAENGATPAANREICCLSHELLALLESLVTSPEIDAAHPLGILSLIRKATEKDPKKKGYPNHGRLLPKEEQLIDLSGRVVVGLATGIDINRFAGHKIRLGYFQKGKTKGRIIGPPIGDGHHVITAEEGKIIKDFRDSTLKGVTGVLRNVPGGVGRRYSFGLPVPVIDDNWRDTSQAYTADHKDLLDAKGYIKDFSLHLFIDSKDERWYPRDKYPPPKYGGQASPDRGHGYEKHLEAFVNEDAKKAFIEAIKAKSDHRPVPIDMPGSFKPDVTSQGIVILFPDGVDHLHITCHRPTDPIG